MSLIDRLNLFDPANTAITVSADSTNNFDVGITGGVPTVQGRDLGVGELLKVRVVIQASFAAVGAATLQVVLKAAPDNGAGAPGAYAILSQTDAIPKASLVAGSWIDLALTPQPPQAQLAPPNESGPPRFYKLGYVVGTGPFTAGQVQAFLTDNNDNPITYPRNFSAI